MAVDLDEYELPYAVADSPKELAEICGTKANTISATICHIDAIDITYCKDCINCIGKNSHANGDGWLLCRQFNRATDDMNFCSWGRRK